MTLEQEIQIREKAIAEQVREETWKEASEQTREETQIETVQKLINSGLLSLEDISKALGIQLRRINELATM